MGANPDALGTGAGAPRSAPRRTARALRLVSGRWTVRSWYVFVVAFFVLLVLLPTLYVLSYVVTGWGAIQSQVLTNPALVGPIWPSLALSFGVALAVAGIDLAAGLPLAWLIVRYRFRGKRWFDTLIDSPLAVTTAGLGFSVVLFWGISPTIAARPPGALGLTADPFLILLLLHLTTTFPYMVRSLAAILEEIEIEYENAARAAGASRLTAARTITLPMFRSGMATGLILVLAKALSDTGGAYAALNLIGACGHAGSTVCNGTGLINLWKTGSGANPALTSALALVSALMILLSLVLLVVVRFVAVRLHFPLRRVWPVAERRLSRGAPVKAKNLGALGFLAVFILVPSFFFLTFLAFAHPSAALDLGRLGAAIGLSFLIGGVATAVDLVLGIPMALLITRGRVRWLGRALDALVNVPYIVPSAALGISLALFWGQRADLALVTMAHVAFTFPFVVRNVVGALEQLDPALEETARTLGARPVQAFRRVVLPAIRPAILAGSIMAFTRSVGETGATVAVVGNRLETAPVLIVNLLAPTASDPSRRDPYGAALAQLVLLAVSFAAIFGMRSYTGRRRRRG